MEVGNGLLEIVRLWKCQLKDLRACQGQDMVFALLSGYLQSEIYYAATLLGWLLFLVKCQSTNAGEWTWTDLPENNITWGRHIILSS